MGDAYRGRRRPAGGPAGLIAVPAMPAAAVARGCELLRPGTPAGNPARAVPESRS
jgi:hypothetical protein